MAGSKRKKTVAKPLTSRRKPTPSFNTKKHTFEPFSKRISRMTIDPIRRDQRLQPDVTLDTDADDSFSNFRAALDKWQDLNLSESFITFSRSVIPFCDSLTQILHHSSEIFSLLREHLQLRELVALEPLLDLLTHFIHDLGTRFEPHFLNTLQLVADIASTHQAVEVVEWSFTALTWIFRYLSRLLVPDLRPLYDVLLPLLGVQRQKYYVTRFTAEAFAYLLRKAATRAQKDGEPLALILLHVFESVKRSEGTRGEKEVVQAVSVMLAETVRGVGRELHSSGLAVLKGMLCDGKAQRAVWGPAWGEVVRGVMTAVVHHTEKDTFSEVEGLVLDYTEQIKEWAMGLPERVEYIPEEAIHFQALQLLEIIAAVRMGTRITGWERLSKVLSTYQHWHDDHTVDAFIIRILSCIAQYAPLSILTSDQFRNYIESLADRDDLSAFVILCLLCAQIGADRYRLCIHPTLVDLTTRKWRGLEKPLLALRDHPLFFNTVRETSTEYLQSIQDKLSPRSALDVWLVAKIIQMNPSLEPDFEARKVICDFAGRMRYGNFGDLGPDCERIIFQNLKIFTVMRRDLWIQYAVEFPKHARFASCVSGLHALFVDQYPASEEGFGRFIWDDEFQRALHNNLTSPAADLRRATLSLLCEMPKYSHSALQLLQTIESQDFSHESARRMVMQIRRLPVEWKDLPNSWPRAWADKALFGLLTRRAPSLQTEVLKVITAVSETQDTATELVQTALRWLDHIPNADDELPPESDETEKESAPNQLTEFHCVNAEKLSTLWAEANQKVSGIEVRLQRSYEEEKLPAPIVPYDARLLALRVLAAMPAVAERSSRDIIPHFLNWAGQFADTDGGEADEDQNTTLWSRKEKLAFLELLAAFTNPRALYKSEEVYAALLNQLCSGDSRIQKLAFRAILRWKDVHLKACEENLMNLMDDNRFRDELTTFVQGGGVAEEAGASVMPVLLRLLYGRAIIRASFGDRRPAVLRAIGSFEVEDLRLFVDLTTQEFSKLPSKEETNDTRGRLQMIDERKQIGFVNMLHDLLQILGTRIEPFIGTLTSALLYCLKYALAQSSGSDEQMDDAEPSRNASRPRNLKTIRNLGFKCLAQLFNKFPDHDWGRFLDTIKKDIVYPRLTVVNTGLASGVSGLTNLLEAWSKSANLVLNFDGKQGHVLGILVAWLPELGVNHQLQSHILLIVSNVVELSVGEEMSSDIKEDIERRLLRPIANDLLAAMQGLLTHSTDQGLLDSALKVTLQFSKLPVDDQVTNTFLETCVVLLNQPSRRVPPRSKTEILQTVANLLTSHVLSPDSPLFERWYSTCCKLLEFFRDAPTRLMLCNVLAQLARWASKLHEPISISSKLESVGSHRLLEPDYSQRITGFEQLNGRDRSDWTAEQWRPIVYSLLFHIRNVEELAIRSSAEVGLRKFITSVGLGLEGDAALQALLDEALLPSLRQGMKESDSTTRTEYIRLLGAVVEHLSSTRESQEMRILLMNNDEEASFFNNILHIQQHRRIRAIKRLATAAEEGTVGSWAISQYFIPLLENAVFKQKGGEAHIEAHEALVAIGTLSQRLEWKQYQALMTRYVGMIQSKAEQEKVSMRLLSHTLDSYVKAYEEWQDNKKLTIDRLATKPANPLTESLPPQESQEKSIAEKWLPPLRDYLKHKEESVVSQRVPIAVAAVKMMKSFTLVARQVHLPPILLDICQILRSRDQGSRDLTRKTLAEICQILRAPHLSFVLKALKASLLRGYQLHVLSYTVHSILLALDDMTDPGTIDGQAGQLMDIIIDDTFGATGKEKDAEEYVSKMKEVKSSKSGDTLEILTRHVSVSAVHQLIDPLRALLDEKMSLPTVRKADELLRRLNLGILRNPSITGPQMLQMSYELISASYRTTDTSTERLVNRQLKLRRYLINTRGVKADSNAPSTSSYAWKLPRFAFDLLRAALNKHPELATSGRLAAFIPPLGDALLSDNEEMTTSAMRLLTGIVRVDVPEIDAHCRTLVDTSVRLLQRVDGTTSEMAQAALKLVAAVIRERKDVDVKEGSVAYLLKRLNPDLAEPDQQGLTFNFLRAVISRKVMVPEVYDTMDRVREIMITNQTRTIRDLARGSYFQFLMDYPQARERFRKQVLFLVRNLEYKYSEGRMSVLEALYLLITRIDSTLAQQLINSCFVAVVMVLANDDDAKCKEMAAKVLKEVFARSEEAMAERLKGIVRGWCAQKEQPSLIRVGLQCYVVKLGVQDAVDHAEMLQLREGVAEILQEAEESENVPNWELIYFTLQAFDKLFAANPEVAVAREAEGIWKRVCACLGFPHAWVKASAAKLTVQLLNRLGDVDGGLRTLPLTIAGADAVEIYEEDLEKMVHLSLNSVAGNTVSESLAQDMGALLVKLGGILAKTQGLNDLQEPPSSAPAGSSSDAGSEAAEWGGFDEPTSPRSAKNDTAYPSPPSEDLSASDSSEERLLPSLLHRLTRTLASPNPRAKPLLPHLTALSTLSALLPVLHKPGNLEQTPALRAILHALNSLIDPAIPRQSYANPHLQAQAAKLHDGAQELLDEVRTLLGGEVFGKVFSEVRRGILEVRGRRKREAVLEREFDKEGSERRKRAKRGREAERRKEKGRAIRGVRRGF